MIRPGCQIASAMRGSQCEMVTRASRKIRDRYKRFRESGIHKATCQPDRIAQSQDLALLDTVQPSSKMLWYQILPLLLYALLTPDNTNTQTIRPGDMGAANPNQAEILDIDFPANGPPR